MYQIISREAMRQRGAEAFKAHRPRDSHNMNWHSPALAEWLEGFDQAAQASHVSRQQARFERITRTQAEVIVSKVSPL